MHSCLRVDKGEVCTKSNSAAWAAGFDIQDGIMPSALLVAPGPSRHADFLGRVQAEGGECAGQGMASSVVDAHAPFSCPAIAIDVLAIGAANHTAAGCASVGASSGHQLAAGTIGSSPIAKLQQGVGAKVVVFKPALDRILWKLSQNSSCQLTTSGEE